MTILHDSYSYTSCLPGYNVSAMPIDNSRPKIENSNVCHCGGAAVEAGHLYEGFLTRFHRSRVLQHCARGPWSLACKVDLPYLQSTCIYLYRIDHGCAMNYFFSFTSFYATKLQRTKCFIVQSRRS